jgi:deazaflavin-dependent oxidoreductase (nitroreductase family)
VSESSRIPTPGTPGWQVEHARIYQETNGEEGHIWRGAPILLLTTKGRKSGQQYTTPLIYGKDGDRYLIVGSRGGADEHPQWYLNLVANPEIEVQVLADKFRARASTAEGEEKARLWKTMTSVWPAYDEYQGRTKREIPLVIIERA